MARTVAPHGLHHVTAIAEDPQRNVDFYTTPIAVPPASAIDFTTSSAVTGLPA